MWGQLVYRLQGTLCGVVRARRGVLVHGMDVEVGAGGGLQGCQGVGYVRSTCGHATLLK